MPAVSTMLTVVTPTAVSLFNACQLIALEPIIASVALFCSTVAVTFTEALFLLIVVEYP